METTVFLLLKKPSYNEILDVITINENMELVDDAIKKLHDEKLGKDDLPSFAHFQSSVVSELGTHDLRYFKNELQAYIDGSWVTISSKDEGLREQVNKNTADIKVLWDAIFKDITTNPFNITFQNLDGITLKAGVWNQPKVRLEC